MFKRIPLLISVLILLIVTTIAFAGAVQLPQTGQTKCYDSAGVEIPCAGTGQDGEIQAGVAWPNPRFTVTYCNATGPCAYQGSDCDYYSLTDVVTDNLAGLMWTRNRNPAGYVTWYNAIDYANNLTLCGYSDWRLPNINELESLVNVDEPSTSIWLNTQKFTNTCVGYHYSSTSVSLNNNSNLAWVVEMGYGEVGYEYKFYDFFCGWPVRAGQQNIPNPAYPANLWMTGQTKCYDTNGVEIPCAGTGQDGEIRAGVAWPDPRFTDNGDGTVIDNLTGLKWLKNANCIKTKYPSFDNDYTSGDGAVTWQHALDFVKGINNGTYSQCGAGYSDWRLPNRKELHSLIDYSNYPLLPPGHPFTNLKQFYWSSTTCAYSKSRAWGLNIGGVDIDFPKFYDSTSVWPVRGGQSGSFGVLDHFEFSSIASPQSVGLPFSVTITAKDAGGNTVNYNGEVFLYSNIGSISPTKTYLSSGTATISATIYSAGNNIKIQANAGGKSGESNLFSVTGGVVNYTNLAGTVKDSAGSRIAGATVYLNNGGNQISTTTDNNGNYKFENLAPDTYSIWANHNGRGSDVFNINLSANQCITKDLTLLGSSCNPTALTPILLVPGIMGSSTEDAIYPTLPANAPAWNDSVWDKSGGNLSHGLLDPLWGIAGWEDIINSIKSVDPNNYEFGCNIFTVPYDWRKSISDIATNYLEPWIDEAKTKAGTEKVNIVAHSMGGLIVRSYIQSSDYDSRNDIDKFAMVGTPNHGAANAYYLWEGGDPKLADDVNEPFYEEFINFYSNTLDNIYTAMTGEQFISSQTANSTPMVVIKPSAEQVRNFIQQHVPSVRELLPTYYFLQEGLIFPVFKGITDEGSINNALIELNSNLNLKGVNAKIFAGKDKNTIGIIRVGMPNNLYRDGAPSASIPIIYENPITSTLGDGTVLVTSTSLSNVDMDNSKSGGHSGLIKVYKNDVVGFITGTMPLATSLNKVRLKTQAVEGTTVPSEMTISVRGRVQPYVIDPLGRKSGINPGTNLREDEIPDTFIIMDVNSGSISIGNVLDGTYTLYLKGNYSEDYQLAISYADGSSVLENKFYGFNHANTTSFTFTVNSGSVEKITINHTPLPPTGLQADAIDSGGLKTWLTWTASTDPDVTGYNIYSKYDDEPYLTQIGTSTSNSFDTGHPWTENSTIKTRIYAVSAVKTNGSESFLSDTVKNNDRDHDGLTDEEETTYGTNVSNSDTDGDGLKDGEEYVRGTNPLLTDTDGDGYSDYAEVQAGTDPLDINSFPCTDNDSDGYGNPGSTLCPNGSATDCNDNDPNINPGAVEVCDGVDNNCNGQIDEGLLNTYYRDADGDTYGNPNNTTQACTLPAGYVTNNLDCNDSNAAIKPGTAEICTDGIDNNCNNLIDSADPNCQSSGADLIIYSLTVPLVGIPGSTITVKDTIKNIGTGTASPSTTKFYWSTNSTWDTGDIYLGSRAVPALAALATSTGSTTVTVPAGACSGTFYIIAKADADNVVAEGTKETNNTKYKTIKTGPDLVVSTVTAPLTSGAGKTITAGDTTKNQGGCPAVASTTKLYFSANSTWDAGDTYLGERPVPALAAGATDTGSILVTIPAVATTGTRYIIAKTDANSAIAETIETNNNKSKSIKIGPDLIVSLITAPTSAVRGSTISVTDTTKNNGGGDAGASTTKLYLSTNTTWDAGDAYLGSRPVPMLTAGASSAGSTPVIIPLSIATGPYYIIALADDGNAVVETNENNNKKTKKITIY